ncbi:unnamed protein product, partial [Brassica oleracea]
LGVLSIPCSNHPIYLIWKERNRKIFASFFLFFNVFTSFSTTAISICSAVDRQIRDWLLSIQPSILQFFFACTHPP